MPDISFAIRVVDDGGNPCEGARVYVCDTAIFSSGGDTQYTDENGWAEFSFYNMINPSIHVEVFVEANEGEECTFEDGDTASLTYSYE